jgi:hypothetical protein
MSITTLLLAFDSTPHKEKGGGTDLLLGLLEDLHQLGDHLVVRI